MAVETLDKIIDLLAVTSTVAFLYVNRRITKHYQRLSKEKINSIQENLNKGLKYLERYDK